MTTSNKFEPRLRIGILHNQGLFLRGLSPLFESLFPYSEIHDLQTFKLTTRILSQIDVLVFPGIVGEESPYPEILTALRQHALKESIKKGLILITICASTYSLFDEMRYMKGNGTFKNIEGMGLVSGMSEGPAYKHISRKFVPVSSHLDDIFFTTLKEEETGRTFRAIEFNGPALYPKDQLAKIFLRHANIPDSPIAAITKPYGKGLIIGFGSHIEIPLRLGISAIKNGHLGGIYQNCADSAFEESRLELLDILREKIISHFFPNQSGTPPTPNRIISI